MLAGCDPMLAAQSKALLGGPVDTDCVRAAIVSAGGEIVAQDDAVWQLDDEGAGTFNEIASRPPSPKTAEDVRIDYRATDGRGGLRDRYGYSVALKRMPGGNTEYRNLWGGIGTQVPAEDAAFIRGVNEAVSSRCGLPVEALAVTEILGRTPG